MRVSPLGGTWRRHIEQLHPCYGAEEDADPGEVQVSSMEPVPVLPLAEVVAPNADAPAFSVPAAKATRIPTKPMRMYCNPLSPDWKCLQLGQPEKVSQTVPTNPQGWGQFRLSMICGRFQGCLSSVMVMALIRILEHSCLLFNSQTHVFVGVAAERQLTHILQVN